MICPPSGFQDRREACHLTVSRILGMVLLLPFTSLQACLKAGYEQVIAAAWVV